MNEANVSSTTAAPSATARIAAIRPRGEADSSPVSRYVGQCGRHSPQATHESRSTSAGWSVARQFAVEPGSRPMNRVPSGISVPSGVTGRSSVDTFPILTRRRWSGCRLTLARSAPYGPAHDRAGGT